MADLHPEVRRGLDAVADQPNVNELSPEAAREQMRATAVPGTTPVGSVTDRAAPGPDGEVPVRVYEPEVDGPHPVVVFFHGGGWVLGGLDTHDELCRVLVDAADCALVSVDYRLAPEHPFPAPLEDCYAALEWAAADPDAVDGDGRLAVAGDSAGGNLAAAVALLARDRDGPGLAHQSLVYPVTDDDTGRGSYRANAEGYGLTRAEMEWFLERYLPAPSDVHAANPYALPLRAADLADLPPATVVTAEYDPLRDEGAAYAERLADAGVPVTHRDYGGVVHGFLGWLDDPDLDAARDAVDLLAGELRDSL